MDYISVKGSPIDLRKKQPPSLATRMIYPSDNCPSSREFISRLAAGDREEKRRVGNYLSETPRQHKGFPLQRHRHRVLVVAIAGHGRVVGYIDIRLLQISMQSRLLVDSSLRPRQICRSPPPSEI